MRRLLTCAVLGAAFLSCAAHAQEAPAKDVAAPETPSQQEALYRAALGALADGHPEQAARLLEQIVAREPRFAGAWLDLAISQCELGNAAEAERLFAGLERRFALPPGIGEAIAHYRGTGCGKKVARQDSVWMVAATRGHDTNVNQGASDPRFTIGTGSNQTQYELDASFLPKADNYGQAAGSYMRPLGDSGTSVIAQLYSRWYDREHAQDTASALGALEHTWKFADWRVRGTAALGVVSLDRVLYQRQRQMQAQVTPPFTLPASVDLSLTANLNRVNYPSRPAYDGTTLEVGGLLTYRGPHSLTQATLTRLHDDSADARPGGDRNGWFGSVQWYGELDNTTLFEAGLTHQNWRGDAAYSPGLIDTRRLQNTTVLRAAAQWRLQPHVSLVLELRDTFNHENISLFQYNSRALQLSLRLDNF
jgi:tetratricopeptide (TPR) repeat protein